MKDKILNVITSWCKRHGRYRTIYDRDGTTPYMERYYLLFVNRPTWFPFNITLHKICRSDLPILHNHPWPYATIILKGGYIEHTEYDVLERGPGHVRIRSADSYHWLEVKDDEPSWSLFFMGKRRQEWGFLKDGDWIQHQDYLAWRDTQTPKQLREHQIDETFLSICRKAARKEAQRSSKEPRSF